MSTLQLPKPIVSVELKLMIQHYISLPQKFLILRNFVIKQARYLI